jgi:hypothetical protein
MALEDLVDLAPLDKPASEANVFVTVTVPQNNVVQIHAEMTVVNVLPDKPVSTTSVLEPVPHNASELSMVFKRLVVGTDVVEPVEAVPLDSDARMESACATPTVSPETVDLMVVEGLVELVHLMLLVTVMRLMSCTEPVTRFVTSVAMEPAQALRPPPKPELLNLVLPTALKTVVPLLESSRSPSVKRINLTTSPLISLILTPT